MKQSILIIENDNTLLWLYQEWLLHIGYRVHLAESIQEAEKHLDAHRYHAVVYDIDMAEPNGIDFLRENWLQFKIEGTQIGVISRDNHWRYECESMGIPFFNHPTRMKDLERVVGSLFYGALRPAATRPLPALAL